MRALLLPYHRCWVVHPKYLTCLRHSLGTARLCSTSVEHFGDSRKVADSERWVCWRSKQEGPRAHAKKLTLVDEFTLVGLFWMSGYGEYSLSMSLLERRRRCGIWPTLGDEFLRVWSFQEIGNSLGLEKLWSTKCVVLADLGNCMCPANV